MPLSNSGRSNSARDASSVNPFIDLTEPAYLASDFTPELVELAERALILGSRIDAARARAAHARAECVTLIEERDQLSRAWHAMLEQAKEAAHAAAASASRIIDRADVTAFLPSDRSSWRAR